MTDRPTDRYSVLSRMQLLVAALIVSSPLSAAENLRVRIACDPSELASIASDLETAGYDHLGHDSSAIELIVSAEEHTALSACGWSLVTIEVGRPLREVFANRAVPLGYPTVDEMLLALQAAETAHPDIARVVDLTVDYGMPNTSDGRHLYALKVSDNVALREDEPALLIVAGHHANEIVTPVIALEAVARFVNGYGIDASVTAAVDSYEIWIAPTWNPDGYMYVFDTNNLWRKNRTDFGGGAFGVDLNRNYDFRWNSPCSGSPSPSSSTYRGPTPASEVETQTMMAWTEDLHFAKLLDYHSYSREVRMGYSCTTHPWDPELAIRATDLSQASGYLGAIQATNSHGMNVQWQLARGAEAYLVETHLEFQPPYSEAQTEASLLWPGILYFIDEPILLTGHVVDACDATPLVALIEFPDVAFIEGERHESFLPYGRYHAYPPTGTHRVRYSAPGYVTEERMLNIVDGASLVEDVALAPSVGCPACGNGTLESGEACDDGNTIPGDGCRADCTVEACGDGILDPGEGCDDGNTIPGDGCRADCTVEACGDGNVDPGEGCDDGNTLPGDGCDARCDREGACCDGAGGCLDLSGTACASLGGSYTSDGTTCLDVPSPCTPSCDITLLGPISTLLAAHIPGTPDAAFRWSADTNATDGYELWYIADAAARIPACGTCNPGLDVMACGPTPGVADCVHSGAVNTSGLYFYNVVGICGGQQGAP